MRLSTPCGICDSTGWEGHCDCDPDGHHHCRGQGSCGTHECPACKGEGETFAELTPEVLAQAFHESYETLAPSFGYKTRDASSVAWSDVPEDNKNLMVATAEAIIDRLTPWTPHTVTQWLWKADEAEVLAVWSGMGVSSFMRHARLNEALWTVYLMRWKAKAERVLGETHARLQPYTAYDKQFRTAWMARGVGGTLRAIKQSGLLTDKPVLDPDPLPELDTKTKAELIDLVEKLQALLAIKDEALGKVNVAFDQSVQYRNAKRALEATPEDAKGLYHRLRERIRDLQSESWGYHTAYATEKREGGILRSVLHRKLDRAERAFKEANRQRRQLKRGE